MLDACRESIPTTKPVNKCKTVPRWNDYVKGYFDISAFWHNMWVENDKSCNGIVADLWRLVRLSYLKWCSNEMLRYDVIRWLRLLSIMVIRASENSPSDLYLRLLLIQPKVMMLLAWLRLLISLLISFIICIIQYHILKLIFLKWYWQYD